MVCGRRGPGRGRPHRADHPLGRGGFSRKRRRGPGHSRRVALAARSADQPLRRVPRERNLSARRRRRHLARLDRPEVREPAHRRGDREHVPRAPVRPRPSAGFVSRRADRVRRRHRARRDRAARRATCHGPGQRRGVRRHAGARAEAAPIGAQGVRRRTGAERLRLRAARAERPRTVLVARGDHLRPAAVPPGPAGDGQGGPVQRPDLVHALHP